MPLGWVGVRAEHPDQTKSGPENQPDQSGILNAIANYNPTKTAQENQLREEKLKALRLENEARRRQLEDRHGATARDTPHQWTKADQRFDASMHAARLRHPDFNQVIANEYNPPPQIRQIVFRSPVAGELAYWLAKNPQEYQRIAALARGPATRELRKIEAKVRDPH